MALVGEFRNSSSTEFIYTTEVVPGPTASAAQGSCQKCTFSGLTPDTLSQKFRGGTQEVTV